MGAGVGFQVQSDLVVLRPAIVALSLFSLPVQSRRTLRAQVYRVALILVSSRVQGSALLRQLRSYLLGGSLAVVSLDSQCRCRLVEPVLLVLQFLQEGSILVEFSARGVIVQQHAIEFIGDRLFQQRRQQVFSHLPFQGQSLEFREKGTKVLVRLSEAEQVVLYVSYLVRVSKRFFQVGKDMSGPVARGP